MPDAFPGLRTEAPLGALVRRPAALLASAKTYFRLELRRNRLLYGSWPGVFAATLALGTGLTAWGGLPAGQGFGGTLLFWAIAGLPLTAVVFGAAAGAGLRGPAAEAEAPLPIPPRARALGALSGAAAGAALTTAVIAAVALAASPELRALLTTMSADWGSRDVDTYLRAGMAGALFAGLYLLAASFAFAYAAGHAVLGGALAVLLAAVTLFPLGAGLALQLLYGWPARFAAQAAGCAALALGGLGAFLAADAPRVERAARRPLLRWAALAAGLLAGAAAGWPALRADSARLLGSGRELEQGSDSWWSPDTEREAALSPGSYAAAEHGLLVAGIDGSLRSIDEAGRRVELIGASRASDRLLDLVQRPPEPPVEAARFDASGNLWALRWAYEGGRRLTEVWGGAPDRPLKRFAVADGTLRFAHRGWALGVIDAWDSGRFAELSGGRRGLLWGPALKTSVEMNAYLDRGWTDAKQGLRAVNGFLALEGDLGRGPKHWHLPGTIVQSATGVLRAVRLGGEPAVVTWTTRAAADPGNGPVKAQDSSAVLCRPDGSAKVLYEVSVLFPEPWRRAPGGTLWSSVGPTLYVLLPDGTPLAPLRTPQLEEGLSYGHQLRVVHATREAVWVAGQHALMKVSAKDGRVEQTTRFPEGEPGRGRMETRPLQETERGVFLQRRGRAYFADWSGGLKDLGPA